MEKIFSLLPEQDRLKAIIVVAATIAWVTGIICGAAVCSAYFSYASSDAKKAPPVIGYSYGGGGFTPSDGRR